MSTLKPRQIELFVAQQLEAPSLRDDIDIMSLPFFSIEKTPRHDPIEFERVVGDRRQYIRVSPGEFGLATIWDNDKKKIEQFAKNTLGQHRANFVKAVKNRKVAVGLIDECHYSTSLCHLGNLSYLVGAEKSSAAITEAIKASAPTTEAYGRILEHLKANNVDVATTNTVVGPLLTIDPKTEMFTGGDKVVTDAANKHPLRKRTGRGAFTIPQLA